MDLPKIKFSHRYVKMPPTVDSDMSDTTLLCISKTRRENLSDDFVEYDTQYEGKDYDEIDGIYENYPLPQGDLLILFLMTSWEEGTMIWTTIRRWTEEKEKYYHGLVGMKVQPVIIEK